MNLKNSIIFEVEQNERIYRMEMPAGAPLGEAYMASGKFLDEIVRLINEHAAKTTTTEETTEI